MNMRQRTAWLLAAVVGGLSGQANAEVLEEIVITARKTSESLMDAPLSVGVIGAETIREANIQNINGIANLTPNLKINQAFGAQGDRPVIRGLSSIFTSQELAGYFVDGVWVSGSLQTYDLSNVERVEVIKGPQSATFGRRTFSGAINYVTSGPSEDLSGNIQAQGGTNGLGLIQGAISDTVGMFGYRVTGRAYSKDTQWKGKNTAADVGNGVPDVGKIEQSSVNGSFVLSPTDAMDFTLNLQYSKMENDHYAILLQRNDVSNCFYNNDPNDYGDGDQTASYYCGTVSTDQPLSIGGGIDAGLYGIDEKRVRTSLVWDWELDAVSIRWVNSYNTRDFTSGDDQTFGGNATGSPFNFVNAFHSTSFEDAKDFSSEFWLRGGETIRWAAGAYYFNEQKDIGGADGFAFTAADYGINDAENIALMGSIDWDFTDRLTGSFEGRYAQDKITQGEADEGDPLDPFKETFKSFTYRATLSYDVTDNNMIYGNVSTGVLPGGFNTDPLLVAERPDLVKIDEQDLTQFEFGLKSDIGDSVRLTWALYSLLWEKQARSQVVEIDNGQEIELIGYQANEGDTSILGTEAMLNWFATENLNFGVGFAYNDTEVKDFCSFDKTDKEINGAPLAGVGVDPETICTDLSGAKAPLVPEWEATANVAYSTMFANNWVFSTRWDLSYQDSRFIRPVNLAKTGTETIFNGTIGIGMDWWRVTLWGRNLLDEDSAVSGLRYIDAPDFSIETGRSFAVTPRPEREFGLTVDFKFGGDKDSF